MLHTRPEGLSAPPMWRGSGAEGHSATQFQQQHYALLSGRFEVHCANRKPGVRWQQRTVLLADDHLIFNDDNNQQVEHPVYIPGAQVQMHHRRPHCLNIIPAVLPVAYSSSPGSTAVKQQEVFIAAENVTQAEHWLHTLRSVANVNSNLVPPQHNMGLQPHAPAPPPPPLQPERVRPTVDITQDPGHHEPPVHGDGNGGGSGEQNQFDHVRRLLEQSAAARAPRADAMPSRLQWSHQQQQPPPVTSGSAHPVAAALSGGALTQQSDAWGRAAIPREQPGSTSWHLPVAFARLPSPSLRG